MKTLLLFTFLCYSMINQENDPFKVVMKETINEIELADSYEKCQAVHNKLERIQAIHENRWESDYYMAYNRIKMGMFVSENDQKDMMFDSAIKLVENIMESEEDSVVNSEAYCLRGFATMLKLNVNPAGRGPEMSQMVFTDLSRAIELNSDNPRAYFFMANMQYGMAQFMGTSTEQACKMNSKAILIFNSINQNDSLMPYWGREGAVAFMNNCK